MSDWKERDRSWKRYRRDEGTGKRAKFARRFAMRKDGAREL